MGNSGILGTRSKTAARKIVAGWTGVPDFHIVRAIQMAIWPHPQFNLALSGRRRWDKAITVSLWTGRPATTPLTSAQPLYFLEIAYDSSDTDAG
jgi:hypothetical protein